MATGGDHAGDGVLDGVVQAAAALAHRQPDLARRLEQARREAGARIRVRAGADRLLNGRLAGVAAQDADMNGGIVGHRLAIPGCGDRGGPGAPACAPNGPQQQSRTR